MTTRTSPRRRIGCVALPAVAVAAVACAAGTSTAAAAPPPSTCAPVVILTFRGSGEGLEGGHGTVMTRLVDATHKTSKLKDGYDPSTIPAVPVLYPAVPASAYVNKDFDLFDSLEMGGVIGSNTVSSITATCKDTKFIFAGYSQGVIVARALAQVLGPQQVAGVIGVGDPAQMADMPNVTGGGKAGNGIYRWLTQDKSGHANSDSFYDAKIPYQMWCHPQDWICNFYDVNRPPDAFNPAFDTYDHAYLKDPTEAAVIGAQVALMADNATPRPADPATAGDSSGTATPAAGTATAATGREIDVAFAIDTTCSMGPYIQQARDTASAIVARLRTGGDTVRTSVAEYRDQGDDFRAKLDLDMTTDVDQLRSTLDDLSPDGGGDTPESVYSGVMMALRSTWTPGAVRAMVVLGDAPAKDPEPGTGYTKDSVLAAMKDLNEIPKLPPTLGTGSDLPEDPGTDPTAAPSAYMPAPDRSTVVRPATLHLPTDDPTTPADEPSPTDSGTDGSTPTPGPTATASGPSAGASTTGAVALFAVTSDDDLATSLTPLADASGGKVTKVADDAGDVATALLHTMDLVAHPLTAKLAAPQLAYAGHPVALNAVASLAPAGATYAFDIDGNGTTDAAGPAATQLLTAPRPGRYTAKVTITDADQRTSTAQVAYTVLDPATRRTLPSKPWWGAVWPPSTWTIVALTGAVLVLLGAYVMGWRRGRRRRPA